MLSAPGEGAITDPTDILLAASTPYSATTSASGDYTFPLMLPGTYTLTAWMGSHKFTPASRLAKIPPASLHQDFTCTDCAIPPTPVPLAAGNSHTCALTGSGVVKCWGWNHYGQLGIGSLNPYSSTVPLMVPALGGGVVALAGSGDETCVLTGCGGVKCWGYNYWGQLGDGTFYDKPAPVDVSGLSSGVKVLSAGGYTVCALTNSGGVKCWGNNYRGQLGDGTTKEKNKPVDVPGLSGMKAVATGLHTCAVTASGGVKCWGLNSSGELGDGTTTERHSPVDVPGLSGVTAVVVGGSHTCALTTIGGVKCWGDNYYGELGTNTTIVSSTVPLDVYGLSGVKALVAADGASNCALTASGGVKCWGHNDHGQLGDGTDNDQFKPADVKGLTSKLTAIAMGSRHSCALSDTGGIQCWGLNGYGELGDGTTIESWTPVHVIGFP